MIMAYCFVGAALGQSQATTDTDESIETTVALLDEAGRYEQQISALQREAGFYDLQLIEPMRALAQVYLKLGDTEAARDSFEQQLQIQRINLGLHSAEQISAVNSLLDLDVNQNRWQQVYNNLAHLDWLYARTDGLDTEGRLQGMRDVAQQRLLLTDRIDPAHRARLLREHEAASKKRLELAREHYPADSESLLVSEYEAALADLMIALAIYAEADLAEELMTGQANRLRPPPDLNQEFTSVAELEAVYGARMNTVSNQGMREYVSRYYSRVERLLERFADQGDTEAEAMTQFYLGDAVLIRQQYERTGRNTGQARGTLNVGPAASHYRDGWNLLLEAGIDPSTLDQHLGCPSLIPLAEFHSRLDNVPLCAPLTGDASFQLPDYQPVSEVLPSVINTAVASSDTESNAPSVLLEFEIGANGQATRETIIEISSATRAQRSQLNDLLEELQFRPALRDGRLVSGETYRMKITLTQ
ncbi:MAG: hypothetical protein WDZ76_05940 [Pseudohongiellaceae bacterium]